MFLQIIDAMIFLSWNGVVHGDLACRNVLLFRFDENDPTNVIVKVTDFGLSRYSTLYSLAPGAAKTTLNLIPVRYVAPELLSTNVTSNDYTEKSDVYSMGVLMWEAYSRGTIPWSKMSDDSEVIRRVINGELLLKPSNCSELYWLIISQTWSKFPKDRPTFNELKRLLTEEFYSISSIASNRMPLIITLSNSSGEFRTVEKQFLDGWPNEIKSQIRVDAIHKINNPSLQSRYQQFVHSNPKFAREECIGWHGTSAKCHNESCMSSSCTLCQIIQNGFKKECARKDTSSYRCWGNATYFSNQTFVCQTYNGASQIDNRTNQRCTIMAKINRGYTVRGKKLIDIWQSAVPLAMLIARMNYDTVTVSRDYYIAPAEYLLLYNEFAAIPTYIVVYSFQTKSLQVRKGKDDYCKFHNEHHGCSAGCDGHYSYAYASCLGDGTPGRSFNLYNGIPERDPYKLNDGTDLASLEANILSTMRRLNMSENCS